MSNDITQFKKKKKRKSFFCQKVSADVESDGLMVSLGAKMEGYCSMKWMKCFLLMA